MLKFILRFPSTLGTSYMTTVMYLEYRSEKLLGLKLIYSL